MLKKIAIGLICIAAATGPTVASAEARPALLPTEYATATKYRLDYSDLEGVLHGSVLEMGRSTHQRAPKPTKSTGSNMRLGNHLPSRLEGNRVMLHEYGEPQITGVGYVRDDLLAVPQQLPIEKLSKNEQLAYWLNLHNIIVLAQVAELYPITMLDKKLSPFAEDSLYFTRIYNWNGIKISANDIRQHVLANWDDPVVIYGFYFGAIGTPNIRKSAYTGATVYAALKDNAEEFINSVRGTQVWNKTKLRVSTYYKASEPKFPNFEADLLAHLNKYAAPKFRKRLQNTTSLVVDIDDWHIADLYNGKMGEVAGSYASTVTDAYGNSLKSGMPEHVTDLLKDRQLKLSRRPGKTGIEEVPDIRDTKDKEKQS